MQEGDRSVKRNTATFVRSTQRFASVKEALARDGASRPRASDHLCADHGEIPLPKSSALDGVSTKGAEHTFSPAKGVFRRQMRRIQGRGAPLYTGQRDCAWTGDGIGMRSSCYATNSGRLMRREMFAAGISLKPRAITRDEPGVVSAQLQEPKGVCMYSGMLKYLDAETAPHLEKNVVAQSGGAKD